VHKYERLEKLYYRKQFLKIFITFLIVVLFLFFILNLFNKNNETKTNNENRNVKTEKNLSVRTENNITQIDTNKTIKIAKKIEKNISKEKNETNITKHDTVLTFRFEFPKIDLNETNVVKKKSVKISKKHSAHIVKKPIIIEEKINVNELIKSFNINPSYDLAIQISQYYLNNNMLDLAKKWSLKANGIDPSRYESWRIFAIILLKRNKKDKAREILNIYLKEYKDNDEIKKLLRSINE
jgi:type III secretory pathway component EscV